jgi:rfaE bifunctional protein nucleotidyltransferase chain/domain
MKDAVTYKLKNLDELKELAAAARSSGQTVVFANGCFDLLHVGHVRYLQSARALGDMLIVAINSDGGVRHMKGAGRPLQSEQDRVEIVAALDCVSFVTLFSTPTVDPLLSQLKPHIHAKGTDYREETVPERETVRSYGGRVAIVGDPKDHSTRDLIDSILAKCDNDRDL